MARRTNSQIEADKRARLIALVVDDKDRSEVKDECLEHRETCKLSPCDICEGINEVFDSTRPDFDRFKKA